MFPQFKQGDYDEGFLLGIQAVAEKLTTDEAKEELLLNTNSPKWESKFLVKLFDDRLLFVDSHDLANLFQNEKLRGERNIRYREIAPLSKEHYYLVCFFGLCWC